MSLLLSDWESAHTLAGKLRWGKVENAHAFACVAGPTWVTLYTPTYTRRLSFRFPPRVFRCMRRKGSIFWLSLLGLLATSAPRAGAQSEGKPVHFVRDVVPTLTKLGCNAG